MSVIYVPREAGAGVALDPSQLTGLEAVIERMQGDRQASFHETSVRMANAARQRFDSIAKAADPPRRKEIHKLMTQLTGLDRHLDVSKRVRLDSMTVEQRMDNDGFWFIRELSHILTGLWTDKKPKNTALELFAPNEAVPAGAREFIARRISEQGEAQVYRGGTNIPRVSLSRDEQIFPIRTLVTSTSHDLFEKMASDFAGFDTASQEMRAAKEILLKKANTIFWKGDLANGLYGMLNYPYIAEYYSDTPFVASSSADDMIAALNQAAEYAEVNSGMTLRSDSLVVAPRIYNVLAAKPRSTGTDTTVLSWWQNNNSQGIRNVRKAAELQAAGPGGEDGLFFYKEGPDGPRITMPQPFAVLPMQQVGFQQTTVCYMRIGSVAMQEPGEQVVVWSPAP